LSHLEDLALTSFTTTETAMSVFILASR
jgi:hypothetical protein